MGIQIHFWIKSDLEFKLEFTSSHFCFVIGSHHSFGRSSHHSFGTHLHLGCLLECALWLMSFPIGSRKVWTIFERDWSRSWIGSFLFPLLACLAGGRYPRGDSPPPLQTSCFIQRHSFTIITLHSVSSTSWHSVSRISLQVISMTGVQTESETSSHTSSSIISHFSTSVAMQDSSSTSSQTSSKKRSQKTFLYFLVAVILL